MTGILCVIGAFTRDGQGHSEEPNTANYLHGDLHQWFLGSRSGGEGEGGPKGWNRNVENVTTASWSNTKGIYERGEISSLFS